MGFLLCPLLIWSIPWEDGDHGLCESLQLFIYGKTSKFITVGCSQNAAAFKSNIISYISWLQLAAEYGGCNQLTPVKGVLEIVRGYIACSCYFKDRVRRSQCDFG